MGYLWLSLLAIVILCPTWFLVGWNEHKRHLAKQRLNKLQRNSRYGVMGHDVQGHTIVEWWLAGQDEAGEQESEDG